MTRIANLFNNKLGQEIFMTEKDLCLSCLDCGKFDDDVSFNVSDWSAIKCRSCNSQNITYLGDDCSWEDGRRAGFCFRMDGEFLDRYFAIADNHSVLLIAYDPSDELTAPMFFLGRPLTNDNKHEPVEIERIGSHVEGELKARIDSKFCKEGGRLTKWYIENMELQVMTWSLRSADPDRGIQNFRAEWGCAVHMGGHGMQELSDYWSFVASFSRRIHTDRVELTSFDAELVG
jgi:hypothetical protein